MSLVNCSYNQSFISTKYSLLPNAILNKISDDKIPKNVGDFMLIDKEIVNHIKKIFDHNIYLRGIIFSLGYKKKSINFLV